MTICHRLKTQKIPTRLDGDACIFIGTAEASQDNQIRFFVHKECFFNIISCLANRVQYDFFILRPTGRPAWGRHQIAHNRSARNLHAPKYAA